MLHALRLKGFADTPAVAALAGLDHQEAGEHLEKAAAAGQASRREGRVSGWALTPEGRARHAELIGEELVEAGARAAIEDAYRRFRGVNGELLRVCTDWQLRAGVLNDHADRAHDDGVVARLVAVDQVIQPVCADLAEALARFAGYGPRLAHALQRVEAGDHDWFARPMIDSYHTVWFELHEDLLVTLGIERAREGGTP